MTTDVTTPATGPGGAESPAGAADLLARPPVLPAAELGPHGIRANSISPGQTPTALRKFSDPAGGDNAASAGRPDRPTRTGRIPLGRRGTLDDYVGAILFLISGLSAYVTGTDLLVDGGAAILR